MKTITSRFSFAGLMLATALFAGCSDNAGKTTQIEVDQTEFEAVKAQVAAQQAEFGKAMEKASKEDPAK
jgi:outer membrane murein-binding lipoprotein Lpp